MQSLWDMCSSFAYLLQACAAHASALSFLVIPTWLGTQQNLILRPCVLAITTLCMLSPIIGLSAFMECKAVIAQSESV